MLFKRIALLGPLLAASSTPVTFAADSNPVEPCGEAARDCPPGSPDRADRRHRTLARIGPYQVYWGDLHGHTAHSDGKGTLDHYFTYARDTARLDFVVVTDHDHGSAAPWRLPRDTWRLTNEKADQYTVNGGFVGIAGYEWTSQPTYWTPGESLFAGPAKSYNHKNVYFPTRVDYLFSSRDLATNSPDRLARAVRMVGGLIHNNHLES
ncbi:MAG: hypothetical protein OEW17_05915, partial [Gemmatimonadota bacterium]|nr:hypothetical protein [Gemmatimonadota bacterium]